MSILINLLLTGIAVAVAAYLTPGVVVDTIWTAVLVGIVLAVVNVTIGLLLRLVTLPFNIMSLGLVSFIIGVGMLLLTDKLVNGFSIASFWYAVLFAIILSVVQMTLGGLSSKRS